MPIEPQIPLEYKPPQIENPTHIFSQALSLQHLAQQGPLIAQRIEAEKLENQKRREDMADSDALKRAYLEVGHDSEKLPKRAAELGASPRAIEQIVNQQALTQDRLLKLDDSKRKRLQEQAQAVAQSAQATLAASDDQLPSVYESQRADLIKKGHITQEEAPEFSAFTGGPSQAREWLQIHANSAVSVDKQIDNIRQAATERRQQDADKRAQESHDVDMEGKKADSAAKVRKNASTTLADAADTGDKEEYSQAFYKLSKDERADFPHPDKFDEDTAARVRNLGMSPSEQSAAGHRATLEEIAQSNLELRRDRARRADQATANSRAVDARQARNEYDKNVHNEGVLHGLRRSLGAALSSGNTYVDRLGRSQAMDKASGGSEETKATLIEEMKGRLDTATEELANTITSKYDAGVRLGMTPKVSLEQALDSVRAGAKAAPAAPAAAPVPATKPDAPEAKSTPIAKVAAPRKINRQTGQVITLKDGKWVDEKTGQPVQ